jgi:hypothetical protein
MNRRSISNSSGSATRLLRPDTSGSEPRFRAGDAVFAPRPVFGPAPSRRSASVGQKNPHFFYFMRGSRAPRLSVKSAAMQRRPISEPSGPAPASLTLPVLCLLAPLILSLSCSLLSVASSVLPNSPLREWDLLIPLPRAPHSSLVPHHFPPATSPNSFAMRRCNTPPVSPLECADTKSTWGGYPETRYLISKLF